jgi:hypothetical protein
LGIGNSSETTMRSLFALAVLLAFAASGAIAQSTAPPAQQGPQNSAISSNRHVTAPVQGLNSFTESEARSRIEKLGFANVGKLTKDDNGIWSGRATKDGQQVDVSLDYQGNVIAGSGTTGMPASGSGGR